MIDSAPRSVILSCKTVNYFVLGVIPTISPVPVPGIVTEVESCLTVSVGGSVGGVLTGGTFIEKVSHNCLLYWSAPLNEPRSLRGQPQW